MEKCCNKDTFGIFTETALPMLIFSVIIIIQFISFDDFTNTSFIQTRGSVPLFWEQPGVQVGPFISTVYENNIPECNKIKLWKRAFKIFEVIWWI